MSCCRSAIGNDKDLLFDSGLNILHHRNLSHFENDNLFCMYLNEKTKLYHHILKKLNLFLSY